MRFKGTLTDWNDDRGFGFIQPAEGGARVFFHISAFRERAQRPVNGNVLTYELAKDERGRPRAQQVRYTRSSKPEVDRLPSAPQPGRAIVVSGLFLAVLLSPIMLVPLMSDFGWRMGFVLELLLEENVLDLIAERQVPATERR